MAAEVVKKMGILTGGDGSQSAETEDPHIYSARVAEIIGTYSTGPVPYKYCLQVTLHTL